MNRYEDSLVCYDKISTDFKKYYKAVANKALLMSMTSHFTQALSIIDLIDVNSLDNKAQIKFEIKHSNVLKRGSCYP